MWMALLPPERPALKGFPPQTYQLPLGSRGPGWGTWATSTGRGLGLGPCASPAPTGHVGAEPAGAGAGARVT